MIHVAPHKFTNAKHEQWKPIWGYSKFYEISNHGRIRSLPRIVDSAYGAKRKLKGQLLTHSCHTHGWVALYKYGQGRWYSIEALLQKTFKGSFK